MRSACRQPVGNEVSSRGEMELPIGSDESLQNLPLLLEENPGVCFYDFMDNYQE